MEAISDAMTTEPLLKVTMPEIVDDDIIDGLMD